MRWNDVCLIRSWTWPVRVGCSKPEADSARIPRVSGGYARDDVVGGGRWGLAARAQHRHGVPVTIRPQAQHEALLAGLRRQQSEAYAAEYARRARAEGAIAQGTRSCDLCRSRYVGLAKTHLQHLIIQHLIIAAVMKVVRILNWRAGAAKATTPISPLARLYLAAT